MLYVWGQTSLKVVTRWQRWRHGYKPRDHGHTDGRQICTQQRNLRHRPRHVPRHKHSNYTQDFTDKVTTTNTTQGNNNQETLQRKRKQAAERVGLCRARKREQLLTTRVMYRTASNEQPTTPPSFLAYDQKHWSMKKHFMLQRFWS
jgi:hypothetical protein